MAGVNHAFWASIRFDDRNERVYTQALNFESFAQAAFHLESRTKGQVLPEAVPIEFGPPIVMEIGKRFRCNAWHPFLYEEEYKGGVFLYT